MALCRFCRWLDLLTSNRASTAVLLQKPTWLYSYGVELPSLAWGRGEQRIPQWMLDRYGYERARRMGWLPWSAASVRPRSATRHSIRDLLLLDRASTAFPKDLQDNHFHHRTDEPEMIVSPRIEAAANWLMSDDSAYARQTVESRSFVENLLRHDQWRLSGPGWRLWGLRR